MLSFCLSLPVDVVALDAHHVRDLLEVTGVGRVEPTDDQHLHPKRCSESRKRDGAPHARAPRLGGLKRIDRVA
jgi:hypothetical protein